MKTIMTVCGTGLGSSFVVEMNLRTLLDTWGLSDQYQTTHGAVYEVNQNDAEYFVIARDLEDIMCGFPNLIILNSIIDQEELEEKLYKALCGKQKGTKKDEYDS